MSENEVKLKKSRTEDGGQDCEIRERVERQEEERKEKRIERVKKEKERKRDDTELQHLKQATDGLAEV